MHHYGTGVLEELLWDEVGLMSASITFLWWVENL